MKTRWIIVSCGILIVIAAGSLSLRGGRVKAAQLCSNNLLRIDGAKEQWALQNKAKAGAPVTLENIMPYLGGTPTCNVPSGKYIVGKVGEEPKCTVHGTSSQFKPDRY
jgi:hypothetical protein